MITHHPEMEKYFDEDRPISVEIQDAQARTLRVPGPAMAVAIDAGNPNGIRPRNKQVIGHRLAPAALGSVYGQPVEYRGPTFQAMGIDATKPGSDSDAPPA